MAGKFIIHNRVPELDDHLAMEIVRQVIHKGRISNDGKQFCYASSFNVTGIEEPVMVYTDLNAKSDKFVIIKYPNRTKND